MTLKQFNTKKITTKLTIPKTKILMTSIVATILITGMVAMSSPQAFAGGPIGNPTITFCHSDLHLGVVWSVKTVMSENGWHNGHGENGDLLIDHVGGEHQHAAVITEESCLLLNQEVDPIEVEKTWTHTDYNWDPVCDNPLATPTDGRCILSDESDVGPTRPANINNNGENSDPDDDVLADPLPFDDQPGVDKYTVFAQLHREKFSNTNPGAFYALTTIDVLEDLDGLWVEEIYEDCFAVKELLKFVSRDPTRNVKVAVADDTGDVTELTDLLYDTPGAIVADDESADVHIEGALATEHLTAGSTVYVLVKFQDDLRGNTATNNQFDAMCNNTENVESDIGGDIFTVIADAALRITNDSDVDGINNNQDNCPFDANTDQADGDGDTIGNVCDAFPNDNDNDGVDDGSDQCPGSDPINNQPIDLWGCDSQQTDN